MKKRLGLYLTVWAVLLALFNVIAFVSVGWTDYEKYSDSFWIGYIFITVEFVGQLVCAVVALKSNNSQKTFYNIPLIRASYIGLVVSFVVGGLCMLISPLPYWIGILVCAIVLALNILSVAKAGAAASEVGRVDEKVKKATSFIYDMRADSESLLIRAKTDDAEAICKKVRDAFKYSDPVSNALLTTVEEEIKTHFDLLKKAVTEENAEVIAAESEETLALIAERNNKCKRLK